ncbi:GCN5-related N-acetyltransferase [Methylocella tundrae]|uniref:GCN5-related N-acetyltransferase n=1 Tax=Methylocella tundrae TaxID=227605 RepID=A0A8B6M0X1_METTU|nr:ribosomal protein S18-alanine N-acetyltransferase [Methylocella tundrae]VTZ22193.1 GCN5-related N-acetyltransferase [Methylocella tundrae]VTZ48355.1 GCN5-related N-acetyltransferase [Methylocella tundrae]
MFSLFVKGSAPAYRPIGAERSAECALIHAGSFAYPWAEADFEQLLLGQEIVANGAIEADDRALAAFILSRAALDEAEILTIAVAPAWRRYGVGRTLLATHIASLTKLGIRRLFLEVDTQNAAARALYDAAGFRQIGERKAYYRKQGESPASALVMRLDLGGQV